MREPTLLGIRIIFFNCLAGADDVGEITIRESVSELIELIHRDQRALGRFHLLRATSVCRGEGGISVLLRALHEGTAASSSRN